MSPVGSAGLNCQSTPSGHITCRDTENGNPSSSHHFFLHATKIIRKTPRSRVETTFTVAILQNDNALMPRHAALTTHDGSGSVLADLSADSNASISGCRLRKLHAGSHVLNLEDHPAHLMRYWISPLQERTPAMLSTTYSPLDSLRLRCGADSWPPSPSKCSTAAFASASAAPSSSSIGTTTSALSEAISSCAHTRLSAEDV